MEASLLPLSPGVKQKTAYIACNKLSIDSPDPLADSMSTSNNMLNPQLA